MRPTIANADTSSAHCLTINWPVRNTDGQVILHSMTRDWPKGWVELARYGRPKSINQARVISQWAPPCDFFVFRDMYVHRSWQVYGITPKNIYDIISVTISKDQLSFIVGRETCDAQRVVLNAVDSLKSSRAASELPPRLFAESQAQRETRLNKKKLPYCP